MGQVGNDPFGHYLATVIQAEGVDVTALTFSDVARTALAFVSLGANGERSFQFYRHPSADMLMTTDDLRLEVLDHAKIFHFGSITTITEPSKTATLQQHAPRLERGLKVSYDPNLRLALWEGRRMLHGQG
jgi:fructokinase